MSPSHIRPAPSVYLRVFITPWHWRALHISSSVDVHCWISTALKTLQYEDRLRQHKRWDAERSSCHQHKGVLELVVLHLLSASSHMLRYIHSSSVLIFKGNYCEAHKPMQEHSISHFIHHWVLYWLIWIPYCQVLQLRPIVKLIGCLCAERLPNSTTLECKSFPDVESASLCVCTVLSTQLVLNK